MQSNLNLKHRMTYSKKAIYIYMGLVISFGIIAIVNLLKAKFPLVSLAFVIIFLILMFQERKKLSKNGSFEEIDVIDNVIYYRTENMRLKQIKPEDIKRIDIKDCHDKGEIKHNIKIVLNDSSVMSYSDGSFLYYDELVEKLKRFRDENNIGVS